jgi:hypothetical protein
MVWIDTPKRAAISPGFEPSISACNTRSSPAVKLKAAANGAPGSGFRCRSCDGGVWFLSIK